jgi:hypothetical protein
VIIVNAGEGVYGPRYGKRGTRGGETIHNSTSTGGGRTPVSDAFGNNNRSQRPSSTAGRVPSENLNNNAVTPANRTSRQNTEYYNRTWRRVTQEPAYSGGNSNSNSNSSGRTSNSNSNSNWNNSNSNSNRTYTPSRSESNSSFGNSNSGGGGRSSGSSGGGGGGRSRGGRGN